MLGKLIALSKNGEEKESLPVVNLHFFIGSDLFCDLRINHKDIAAQHCLITSQKNKPALIRNLSRTVPTLVNSTEIGSSDVELKNNDIIAIRHKNYKWCYESSSSPSTSSQGSFVVATKNRKSWPLFKNKLVAVVPPQRRDEQNEGPPKKRRGTIAEENLSKNKATPKVLAIKGGLRATNKPKFGKRKSSVKNSPNISPGERTPKVLPSLSRKSVKFLDTASAPRSRLGTRGRKSSYATPYKCTPGKQKVSVYSTPPSSFRHDKNKPIKSILKTPSSSSTTPRKDTDEKQRVLDTSDILTTPLSNVAEVSVCSPLLSQNDLLQTPVKGNQPEIVMRSSRRKAAIIRSPPSTPKSITKKRKSPEEKSIEASERAAKKLKKVPPHAIDKKKRAALLQCHRKSLTPHPVARRSGKLITNFPSSFSSRLETNSPARTTVSSKFSNSRKSDSLKLSTDLLTPTVLKYSSLGKSTDPEVIIHSNTASNEKIKQSSRKNSQTSFSKTSPIVKKFTRASRAARISNSLPPKTDATDVLSALDLSRRWPSSSQEERCANNSSQDLSNLSGFKKLFSVDKTLDVRELFLEMNSETENATEKSSLSLPEDQLGRISRSSVMLKGKQSTDKEELVHSFHSEGAHDLPCSVSLLSGSLTSLPSYSSTSRRSLSLKRGRKSTLSPKEINLPLIDQSTEEQQSIGKKTTQSIDNNSFSFSRKGRRCISVLNGSSCDMQSSMALNITDEINKKSIDTNHFSSPLNGTLSRNTFGECNVSQKGLNHSSSDVSVFSLGSFNSSYHKSRSGDSSFLSQASNENFVNKDTFLDDSVGSDSAKDAHIITPNSGKGHSKGRISLRRAVLMASTPKPGKLLNSYNESLLPFELKTEETRIDESCSNKLQMNRYRNIPSTDIASGKLKKTMKKGKGFISKSYLQSASLPLTADSSVLKNLSAISTSVADLRTTRNNKLSCNGSKTNSPKTSEKLINNNMNDSINTGIGKRTRSSKDNVGYSQHGVSPNLNKRSLRLRSADQITLKQTSMILQDSDHPRLSKRKADDSKTNKTSLYASSSSPSTLCDYPTSDKEDVATSVMKTSPINRTGRRGRPSKLSVGVDNSLFEKSAIMKKRSRSLPLAGDQITPQQNSMITLDSGHPRRSSRKADDSKMNKSMLDASSPSISTFVDNPISNKEDSTTQIINTTIMNSTGRRGRPSKLSIGADNSHLEKSANVKKRSRSLPSADDQIKLASSSSVSTLYDNPISEKENGSTLIIKTTPISSTGKRGWPSKLSNSVNNSQSDKSLIVEKHSRGLISADDHMTPQQTSMILQDPDHPRRSSRIGDDSKINKTKLDASNSSPQTLGENPISNKKDGATPINNTTPINHTGKRGRPSKLSVGVDNSQLEKSAIVKKRSRSLPSADDQITLQQTSIIVQDPIRPRRSSRKADDSKINKDMLNASTSSPSTFGDNPISNKEDGDNPIINTTPIYSTGRRGRPSKLSIVRDISQLEKSAIVKKRSRSLSTADKITPKENSTMLQDSSCSRRSSRKADDSKINKDMLTASTSSPSTFGDNPISNKEASASPIINTTSTYSTGRRGRPSKLSIIRDNSQLEKSAMVKKCSRSLPSTDDQITPQQTSMIMQDSGHPRRSSRKADDSKINKTMLDASSLTPSTLVHNPVSNKEDGAIPVIDTTAINNTGRRGRPSKLSVGVDNSQLEKTTIVKKHSQSLPSADDHITPQQTSMIVHDPIRPRRSSRKADDSKINKDMFNTSTSSPSTFGDNPISSKEDGATPIINTTPINHIGGRGRHSKLSVGFDNSHLEKSAIVKKRSRSLPIADDAIAHPRRSSRKADDVFANDQITPQQTSRIVQDSGHPRHSSRKADDSKINKTMLDASSLTPSTLVHNPVSNKEDGATPFIDTTTINNTGRRGRPSKLSVGVGNSQLEKSAIVKKRSRSLPSADDQITLQQTSIIVQDPIRPRRSSRKADDSKINKDMLNASTSSPSTFGDNPISNKEASASPIINTTSTYSTGRRGRPSKLSIIRDNSQLEKSAMVKKRSRSLISADDQITPQQTSLIVQDPIHPRRSSRKADDSKINKDMLNVNASTSSPSTCGDNPISKKEDGDNPIINTTPIYSTGRRGRPSKLSIVRDISQLEKSAIVKKRSRSLSTADKITPKENSTMLQDSSRSRRSSRKSDDSKIFNKISKTTSSLSSPFTLINISASDDEFYATPYISSLATVNASKGNQGRISKQRVSANNSQLKESITEKRSLSLVSLSNVSASKQTLSILKDIAHLRRSSRKADDVFANNSQLKKSTSLKNNSTSLSYLSVKSSVGTRNMSSEFSVGPDNSQSEKSCNVKKRSRSFPFSEENQTTAKQALSISDGFVLPRRSSRKGENSTVLNKALVEASSLTPSVIPDTAIPGIADGATPESSSFNNSGRKGRPSKHSATINVKSKEISLKEYNTSQNLDSRTSFQLTSGAHSVPTFEKNHYKRESVRKGDNLDYEASSYTPSFDHSEGISVTAGSRKSNKRNYEEVSPVSGTLSNISSVAKKKLKISNSECFPMFSDIIVNNKKPNYLDIDVGNSKKFGAFSSTPIVAKNPYLIDNCGEKNRSRCKFRNIQSPVGLSPIVCGNEADFSANDESSQISMICLRHSQCPSDVGEKSKSDSLIISSNMLFEASRPHNDSDLDLKNSSNHDKNNPKVKLSKRRASSLSTTQNRLPLIQQTPVASQLPAMNKLSPQARTSEYGLNSLHESQKDKVINITSDLKSKTPIIKLSPGKSRTRSRKVVKDIKSPEEKKQSTIKHKTLFAKETIAQLRPASNNDLSKRGVSNLKRLSADKNSITSPSKSPEVNAPVTKELSSNEGKAPVRRGRPLKKKDSPEIKSSVNKVLQRRGRSAKNIDLSSPLNTSDAPTQKISKKKKQKAVVAEDLSTSSKQHKVENISSISNQTISEMVEKKSPTSIPKTRSKVAVLALKTPRKSVIISSPIVKYPSLNRPRVKKIKSENISSQKREQKKGRSAKEASINVTSEDLNILLNGSISTNKGLKRGKKKIKNTNPQQKDNLVKQSFILSSPVNRRGRSAVHNSSSRNEKLVATVSKQDLVVTSPRLPKRGRFIKAQGNVNNISTKEKDLNEFNEEPSTLDTKPKRGRSQVKNSDISTNKRGRPKKNLVNDNETITSTSLPKKGRPRKISESVEGENISLRKGRSVVKNSDSLNKRGRPKKGPVNNNETVASPSLTVAKRGRRDKVEIVIATPSSEEHVQKTSVSGESQNTYLRRGRSVVKNSDSSPKHRSKPKKDPENKNETITSPSLPKRGKPSNKVQDGAITDSRKKNNLKGSDREKVQTDVSRRGRSAVKEQHSLPDKTRKLITLQPEGDTNCKVDSTLPKRGRSAKRKANNTSESTDLSSLALQKRQSSVVRNSDFSPVKTGTKKSKTKPANNDVAITSPSSPKKGRPAKIQKGVVKGTSNEVSKSIDNQNALSSKRRGRSAALEEHSLGRQEKPKQDSSKNNEPQISSSKKGRTVVLENVSPPRRGRSETSKPTSPRSVKNKMVNTENKSKLPSRRGKIASSPKPEVRKVSDRSKAIKKNSKKENRPLKSAIKKSLSKRLSRKSSLLGFIKHGRRKVHFNKNVVRNSNSKKK